jgi:hypothetical protein
MTAAGMRRRNNTEKLGDQSASLDQDGQRERDIYRLGP